MLPYPSGILHMGHVRNYMINDMMYRHLRMNGYNALMPMGWDAFGLPAENAAIKSGVPPAKWTYDNIATMKKQMQAVSLAIDWSREVTTCKPEYYRWNQWLFLKMLEKGIAYKKTGVVNWDPVDQTVLANEQVIDGRGWRTGALVEKREIPMYYMAITRYADELLDNLDRMDGWPGARAHDAGELDRQERRRASPSRARHRGDDGKPIGERLYVRLHDASRHDHGRDLLRGRARAPAGRPCGEGEPRTGFFHRRMQARNGNRSRAGDDGKKGHADRTFRPASADRRQHSGLGRQLCADSLRRRRGHGRARARRARFPVRQKLRAADQAGDSRRRGKRFRPTHGPWYADKTRGAAPTPASTTARLSACGRRYRRRPRGDGAGRKEGDVAAARLGHLAPALWGTPIPIVHCEACGDVPVPEADLPVILPEDCVPDGTGNPLRTRADFVNCTCPRCGRPAQRETDTMDVFVDSSWYYMLRLPRRSDDGRRAMSTGCRWTSTSAASSMRSCTCSTRGSGPR
jgi:leucyl-tRNA synthetase